MASIIKRTKRGKPSYYVVFRLDGKQIWKNAGSRRIDADHLKAKLEIDLHNGVHIEMPDIGLKEFSKKWLDSKKPDIRPQTWNCYKGHFKNRILPFFGNRKLKSIRTSDIEAFKSYLFEAEMSPATISKYLLTIKMSLKTAVIWGYISRNPAEYIKKPLIRKYEPLFLTPDQLPQLVEATPQKYKALIATAAFTGMRQGELLGLKWDDVDFANNRIYVQRTLQEGKFYDPKASASRRSIDIPDFLASILKNHKLDQMVEVYSNEQNLIFPNEVGKPMNAQNFMQRIFKPILRLAGLPVNLRFHDLRHSYASMLIHQGANIKYVQRQLGHANIQMTLNTYSHLLPDAGKEAIGKMEHLFKNKNKSSVSV